MMHPTRAGIGLIRMGESGLVPQNLEKDLRGMDLMVAEDPPPTSRSPHAAAYEATRQGPELTREQASSTPGAAELLLKWTGLALLVVAGLLAMYLGAGLLGELAARATYP